MHRPSGVIFDLGGTLLHLASANWAAGSRRLLELANAASGVEAEDLIRLNSEVAAEVFEARETSAIELHYEDFIRLQCETLGISPKVSYSEAAREMWRASVSYVPTEGIMGVLKELESNGVKMGVLSNSAFSGVLLEEELARLGMFRFFSFVISSADYGLRKPHHRIVELAVKKMGLAPEKIWFVGDKPDYDITGALKCGLFPVWYNPRDEPGHPPAECLEVKDWHQFEEAFRLAGSP